MYTKVEIMEDVSVKIYVDGIDSSSWFMDYKIKTPNGTFKFHDGGCQRMTFYQWRDFASGPPVESSPDFLSSLTSEEDFVFKAYDSRYTCPVSSFKIKKKYVAGPLTAAIEEAVELGFLVKGKVCKADF